MNKQKFNTSNSKNSFKRTDFLGFTNKYKLPDWITRHIHWYCPVPYRIGVTELISAPRKRNLIMKHWDDPQLRRDYSDFLQAQIGTAVHSQYEDEDGLSEEKLEDQFDIFGDTWTLVGKADNYDPAKLEIRDIKTKAIGWDSYGIEDIEKQLNVYAWQRRCRCQPVNKLTAWVALRDWKIMHSIFRKGYPKCLWQKIDIPLWDFAKQEEFIFERLRIHSRNPFDECTPEEKCQQKTTYAIWDKPKTGNNKAKIVTYMEKGERKSIESIKKAEEIIKEKGLTKKYKDGIINYQDDTSFDTQGIKSGTVWVEKREGDCFACLAFCPARSVCEFSKNPIV